MSILDDTTRLVEKVQAGDQAARAALLAHVCNRLQNLAHQMLRGYPVVRRWSETGDVLQAAMIRLSKALDKVHLESVAHFHKLATVQIRRELIDLARHYGGPEDWQRTTTPMPTIPNMASWPEKPAPRVSRRPQRSGRKSTQRLIACPRTSEKLST